MSAEDAGGPAYRIDGRLAPPQAFYAVACDPRRNVVVEACAGAGKTWMLVSRILRALLDGAQPQEILALTFTRKAAGEMRARLDEWLRAFAADGPLDEAGLERRAAELRLRGMGEAEARAAAPLLAGLHEQVLRSGRSVAVRSFHAWFAQLAAAAPLDTLRAIGLPADAALIEKADDLRDELFARFHAVLQADPALRETYAALIGRHRLARVTAWLEAAWQRRVEVERADGAGHLVASVPSFQQHWPELAALPTPQAGLFLEPLHGQLDELARTLGAQTGKTPRDAATALRAALDLHDPVAAYAAAVAALTTKAGTARKNMGEPGPVEAACEALQAIARQIDQQRAHEDHLQMVALTRVLLQEYARLKHERGLADMGDLESAALALLSDSTLAGWLQMRLDARLRHLLIDEFQDTSPLQWHALYGWLSSYAGAGGGASGQAPLSIFIVGDPKQSIYRFRRAEPRIFESAKAFVVDGLGGSLLACDHTRRCAPAVIDALNAVFEPAAARGEWAGFRAHSTAAVEPEGQVLSLPETLRPPKSTAAKTAPVWRDSLTQPRHEPEEQLRQQEARQVATAIADLVAQGRRPGDIMVLARKRVALRAVSDALAERQLPHVMPEPMNLGDEPEARDLLAVLDVLSSRGQDLSLAIALKCPLFGASDEELLALSRAARGRGSWWAALHEPGASWTGALARARELLARWADAMAWLPPHDLLDRIVHEGEWIARLTATVPRARHERAMQVVDGLMAAALQLDGGRYATPYGFVRALRARTVETQAVPAADAVSLLTVHGAKGLEAPVVFIVDADPNKARAESATLLVDWPVEDDAPCCVAFVAVDSRPPPSLQALQDDELQARAREELNGLYVAMTRAAEELVISRTEPYQREDEGSWWARVAPRAQAWIPGEGDAAAVPAAVAPSWVDLPDLVRVAGPAAAVPPLPAGDDRAKAALGSAVHRVLEWLSGPDADRTPAARRHAAEAAASGAGLEPDQAVDVEQQASAVLDSRACRHFFEPGALAWAGNEVPVVVDGEPGRIDRLVAIDQQGEQGEQGERVWWVLDYKLHAAPDAVSAYRAQMAGYLRAVRQAQPGERVVGAFVAAGGRLIVLDD